MKLQTKISLKQIPSNTIDYNAKVLLLGSCFSENIGNKLSYFKFQTSQNPFGILFHPKAIEAFISNVIHKKQFSDKDLIYQNEHFHHFNAHSSLSSADKNEVLYNLNSAIASTETSLKEASHIIITLGTAWVYKHLESNKIVANCHKLPQKYFLKEILSVAEITESLKAILALIQSVNNNVTIILTVSPVRHLKDGFIENTRSKSHLISAIHNIIDHKKNINYFPSYEIIMDELRDYRFYNEDMIHPNKTAIRYIWEKFVAVWFSENTKKTMKNIEVIQKGILHRPFDKNTTQHQKFLKDLEVKKEKIIEQFPFIKF